MPRLKFAAVFILLIALAGCAAGRNSYPQNKPSATVSATPNVSQEVLSATSLPAGTYLVTQVVDGDTLKLSVAGEEITARLIGVDTPETVHPNKGVECYGKEASAFLNSQVAGKFVQIETDASQGEADKYGRLLIYVWIDNENVNEKLIREGYANEYTYSLPYKYQQQFKLAEQQASKEMLGLWGNACEIGQVATTPLVTTCQYSCSGPDRDCSDFASHDAAQKFFDCCGFSATNDPMQLDGLGSSGDGIACENRP